MPLIKLGIPTKASDGLGYPLASEEDRFKHLLLLGRSGTGKSTYLINLILQELENPLILLDPNGFLAKDMAVSYILCKWYSSQLIHPSP